MVTVSAQRIRMLRERAGMTQSAVAAKIGVTREAVANWERGSSAPRQAMLPLLATSLGVEVEALDEQSPAPLSANQPADTSAGAEVAS